MCPLTSDAKQRAFKFASDFTFADFLTLCDGTRRPSHMALANLLVNIGQLIVGSIALAVAIVALRRK